MPARKKVVVLMALWGKVCPLKDARENKYERLRYLARSTGRIVDSANDLSDDELERVITALQAETRTARRTGSDHPSAEVRDFPNRSGITKEQLWKIWQLEHWLGWADRPQRLEGLLRSRFKSSGGNPQFLTHAQAWRLIEMLFSIAARELLRREGSSRDERPSEEHTAATQWPAEGPSVAGQAERAPRSKGGRKAHDPALAAARDRLKGLLQTWRPPEPDPAALTAPHLGQY